MNSDFSNDLEQAVLSDPYFDKINAVEIGNKHGTDPKGILKEIKEIRKLLKGKTK